VLGAGAFVGAMLMAAVAAAMVAGSFLG